MDANVEGLTSSAGIETVTKYEIEIWAKVERAISGKNGASDKTRQFYNGPCEQSKGFRHS